MSRPAIGYKVLTADQMAILERKGIFPGAPDDLADGYIHLSTADQLTETVDKHFAGQENLWVAAVDLNVLGNAIRWEVSRGGALFPHIYGPLRMAAVIAHGPLCRDRYAAVMLPGPGRTGDRGQVSRLS